MVHRTFILALYVAFSGYCSAPVRQQATPTSKAGQVSEIPAPKNCETPSIEALVQYQEFLRKETDASTQSITSVLSLVSNVLVGFSVLVTCLGALAAFLGWRSIADLKEQLNQQMLKQVKIAINKIETETHRKMDARLDDVEELYRRRHEKYAENLQELFAMQFDATPALRQQYLLDSNNLTFEGKSILWVDDDYVSIAPILSALRLYWKVDITTCRSTQEVLRKDLSHYGVLISNMRRGARETEGLEMAKSVRSKSSIQIILFTRIQHATFYESDIRAVVNISTATNRQELVTNIKRCLMT